MFASPTPSRVFSRSRAVLFAVLSIVGLGSASVQALDLDGNGLDDIWEMSYHVKGYAPDLDSDTDGVSNQQESLAGTDPFYAGSLPKISQLAVTADGAQVSMTGELGKLYQLQATEMICGSGSNNWVTEASMIVRTNPSVMLT